MSSCALIRAGGEQTQKNEWAKLLFSSKMATVIISIKRCILVLNDTCIC